MEKESLTVAFTVKGDELTAALSGEIDHHSAAPVRKAIDAALFKHRPACLTLDLGEVGFMDSSGLGLVLGRVALCQELGARVRLTHPSLRARRVLAVAGIERLENLTVEV